jgi:hypothetical protein
MAQFEPIIYPHYTTLTTLQDQFTKLNKKKPFMDVI